MTIVGVHSPFPAGRWVELRARDSGRSVPIWMGSPEADCIAMKLHDLPELPRPLTHDLLKSVVEASGGTVARAEANDLRDDTFYAKVVLRYGDGTLEVDSRPSDAIALALRSEAPIFVADPVIEKVAREVQAGSGVLEVMDDGHGVLHLDPAHGASGDARVHRGLIRRFGLASGDTLSGRADEDEQLRLGSLDAINGEIPAISHDLRYFGLPVSLVAPDEWQATDHSMMVLGRIYFAPPGQPGIGIHEWDVADANAQEVLDRIIEESEGAFELPSGF